MAPAQFDPSEVWFHAYLAGRSAQDFEKDGDFVTALEKLEQADQMFQSIATYYPKWKTDMVAGGAARTREGIARVKPKADAIRKKKQGVVAELEGTKTPGRIIDPAQGVAPLTPPGILEVDPLGQRRLTDAEAEAQRLRTLLQQSSKAAASERDQLKAQLKAAEATTERLRAQLAQAPVESELKGLNQRIRDLELEREGMAKALTQSRSAHTDALAKIAILETDLKITSQKAADLQRNLKLERAVANDAVGGMRDQLKKLQSTLDERNQQLATAQRQIAGLRDELQQSRDAFSQLQGERDALVTERDHMKALLSLNDAGRVKELIEQNVAYDKQLREANEKLAILNADKNASLDQIATAKNDLVVAKAQINRLKQERRDQDKRLAALEARLQQEQKAIDAGTSSATAAEIETLREVIKRQLLIQERRRQQSQILIAAAKRLGSKDPNLSSAVKLLEEDDLVLTPEEQRLIADRADVDLVNPFRRDPKDVAERGVMVAESVQAYDRAATKAFASGHLLPARELFSLAHDENPGDASALCKLGVVNLRLNDPTAAMENFRRAVELEESNPFAHRMLGFSLLNLGDLAGAQQNVRRSTQLAPDDAKSLNLLATITYRLGNAKDAESLYKSAIQADPVLSDPYFNLALLCSKAKRLDEARDYYQQALERGAAPDPKLEQSFAQS